MERERGKSRPWASPLADYVRPLIAPALAKQGFGETSLIADWPEIVGASIARCCRPIKLQWPPRPLKPNPDARPEPAILVLRVEGAMALEVQHSAAMIVERINAHLGWRCVGRLAFRQGPLEKAAPKVRRKAAPGAQATQRGRAGAAGVELEDLREALARLGARAIEADQARRSKPSAEET